MSNRSLDWASALRDIKADRASRPVIREERLKSTGGLRGSPALPLSAWRGRSGRRYVVGVHPFDRLTLEDAGDAVLIAAKRAENGCASISGALAHEEGPCKPADLAWLDAMKVDGATELHIHRLAEDTSERLHIVADLTSVTEAA